jgi:hypothetical protein
MIYPQYDAINFKTNGNPLVFCEGTDLCTIDFKDIQFRDCIKLYKQNEYVK